MDKINAIKDTIICNQAWVEVMENLLTFSLTLDSAYKLQDFPQHLGNHHHFLFFIFIRNITTTSRMQ